MKPYVRPRQTTKTAHPPGSRSTMCGLPVRALDTIITRSGEAKRTREPRRSGANEGSRAIGKVRVGSIRLAANSVVERQATTPVYGRPLNQGGCVVEVDNLPVHHRAKDQMQNRNRSLPYVQLAPALRCSDNMPPHANPKVVDTAHNIHIGPKNIKAPAEFAATTSRRIRRRAERHANRGGCGLATRERDRESRQRPAATEEFGNAHPLDARPVTRHQ